MKDDLQHAHKWLQSVIGWIVGLMEIIGRVFTGCYITSALVAHLGLDDISEQMEQLRALRNRSLSNDEDGSISHDLDLYNSYGQLLVRWISGRHDAERIWAYVAEYIDNTLHQLANGNDVGAYQLFKTRTLSLRRDVMLDRHMRPLPPLNHLRDVCDADSC